MRTAAATIEVERSGVQAETAFTIKATGKAFDILSSGLYSDKVRAIVRELSCNAYDSHVAAGKADLPIEVKLPTVFDQTFHVRDFGLGLSHESVMQLYTTYFESTKTESDDFIGQLGLGSKSPFSYAPTFTVESRFEGVRRVYTCFKNEQGMPAISLMGEELTEDVNGVTIALAVKRDDVTKFVEAARKVFMYFDPKPTVLGQPEWEPFHIKHTVQGTNWKIREPHYASRMSGPYVIQGFVAYPVDAGILLERNLSESVQKLLKTNLDLIVDIGKVEVAASREALSYDIRTIDNLCVILEQVAVEMYKATQAEFDLCKTPWEVAQLYGKFTWAGSTEFRHLFDAMHKNNPFQWNGQSVFAKVKLDLSNIKTTKLGTATIVGKGKVSMSGTWTPDTVNKSLMYDVSSEHLFVVVDKEAKGHHEVIRTFLYSKGNTGRVLLISPTSKKTYNQAEVDHLIQQLGNPPFVYADTLGIVRTKTYTSNRRTAEQKMVWKGFPMVSDYYGREKKSEKFSPKCWATETVVLEDGGFYIDVERFTAMYNGMEMPRLEAILDSAVELGYLDEKVKVYGIQKREQKHIKDNGDWINVIDHIRQKFTEANKDGTLFNRAIVESAKSSLSTSVIDIFLNRPKVVEALNDGQFKNLMERIIAMDKSTPDAEISEIKAVSRIAQLLGVPNPTQEKSTKIINEWHETIAKYGMLQFINWMLLDRNNAHIVIDYINQVDRVC